MAEVPAVSPRDSSLDQHTTDTTMATPLPPTTTTAHCPTPGQSCVDPSTSPSTSNPPSASFTLLPAGRTSTTSASTTTTTATTTETAATATPATPAVAAKPRAKSTSTPGPGTGRAKRSKHGCRTCRRRRKKCDETRPKCLGCQKLGIECEGYERPLIWGNGIASRGKLKGATVPTMDMWKPSGSAKRKNNSNNKTTIAKNESAMRKSPKIDDESSTTGEVTTAPGIARQSSDGELASAVTTAPMSTSPVSLTVPIVPVPSTTAEAQPAQSAVSEEMDRRQSIQSIPSTRSISMASGFPQDSPGIRISEVSELPHHSRDKMPTTGMSSFAVALPAPITAPAPPSTSQDPMNAVLLPVPSPPSQPTQLRGPETGASPKALSAMSSASSPRIDYVDIFNHNDEPLDQELYNKLVLEFFTSGHLTLYSTDRHESPVLDTVLPLARESLTLRSVCASYQALLSEVPISQFQAIYSSALQQYRADLANKTVRERDCTICAGLLLCSIGASQNLPFTFHIQPVLKLLTMRTNMEWNPFHAHAFEVMGYYDLPSFIVNRRAPRLDIWQTYCMHDTDRSEIEPVSGLPRSLLDIFARLEDADCEERFWYWHGQEGSVMQVHLWDAHRFAGMLKHREIKNDFRRGMKESGIDDTIFETENPRLPPSGVILNRLVASLSVIFRCYRQPDGKDPHMIMNSIFYPLFIAGCQVVRLETPKPEWEDIIRDIFVICSELKMSVEPLETILGIMKWKRELSPDQIAADMGMEIALI